MLASGRFLFLVKIGFKLSEKNFAWVAAYADAAAADATAAKLGLASQE